MHMGSVLCEAHCDPEQEGFESLSEVASGWQIIPDVKVGTGSSLVEGWSLGLLGHSASLNAVNTDRFK